ncbi:hypothetical protein ACFLVS_04180 [Chloroflexota bacterium]
MSKLKPKWVKTDIPSEIKIKLWQVMKDNPTFVAWHEHIARNSQLFTESEMKYVPYSRDTYKKLQQEIIEMPLDEIRLLPNDLQVLIKGIKDLRPDVGLVNGSKETVYKETQHKQEIRNLAKVLKDEIKSIVTSDSFVLELEPGLFALLGENLPITTSKDEIRVTLSNEGEGEASVLPKALCAHLETSDFAKVLTDIASWREGMVDNLTKYHELFTTVRKKLERTYDTSIVVVIPKDSQGQLIFNQSGFTIYFPLLICVSALEQARGSSDYIDMEYRCEGLNLKYGVYTIYIGTSDEHMQLFVDAHREWRSRCAMWKQTKAIAKQRQDLDDIAAAITEQLQTFISMERLPGHCKLCSTSSVKSV